MTQEPINTFDLTPPVKPEIDIAELNDLNTAIAIAVKAIKDNMGSTIAVVDTSITTYSDNEGRITIASKNYAQLYYEYERKLKKYNQNLDDARAAKTRGIPVQVYLEAKELLAHHTLMRVGGEPDIPPIEYFIQQVIDNMVDQNAG